MNLLIVADKTEAKTYEAIAKTAPNTAVLGAVTRIDSDFISLLGDKYNPHAVLLDTDVTAIGTNIQAAVEEITQTYPYMRILVLTDEDDNYDYPVDCIVQGQLSNIKLKEILTSMASGNTFTDTDSEDDPEGLNTTSQLEYQNFEPLDNALEDAKNQINDGIQKAFTEQCVAVIASFAPEENKGWYQGFKKGHPVRKYP